MICAVVSAKEAYQPEFSTAGFYALPNTGRDVYSMNLGWRFHKGDVQGSPFLSEYDDSRWGVVSLPHGLEYLPEEASGCVNYQGIAWYRKRFMPADSLKGKKIFLHFEGIMGKSEVWINGRPLTTHVGGYLPVIGDLTSFIRFGEENIITVKADNSNDPSYAPGKPQEVLDFSYFGGIYRDCWLVCHNPVFVTNANYEDEIAGGGLFVSFDQVSEENAVVQLKTHLRNQSDKSGRFTVVYSLKDADGKVVKEVNQTLSVGKGKDAYSLRRFDVPSPKLWSPDTPYLYDLSVFVEDAQGNRLDGFKQRIGIRSIEFKQNEGLWINGKPYGKIMGTNRHQDFAVLGNALPNSLQWRDAKKLRDAGMKVIRTHYVIDPAFMDACDELGIFALVPTPGWQFWSDAPSFSASVYSDIRNMIRIHRNHASLFFLEPVLNETHYPDSFAKNAADICKQEYPYPYCIASCDDGAAGDRYFSLLLRPTANLKPGKTYFTREWGDNVDDWNSHNSNSRVARNWGETPMLIQAQHYADKYKGVYTQAPQVVGGCFWHSFDHQRGYHPDPFYGGFMDAFRQPKYSYYLFMAQREPEKSDLKAETGPMVFIAHEMTPFSPKDVTVYSNCDEVRLTFLKDGKPYTHVVPRGQTGMPSPVITFKDVFDFMECKKLNRANRADDVFLYAEGLIDGKVVAVDKRRPSLRPDHIRLRVDNENVDLVADGSDVVTVIAEVVDRDGVVKRLNNYSVAFGIEGEGRILGDAQIQANPRPVRWGSAPVLIQSTPVAGKIKLTASVILPGQHMPVAGELEFFSVGNPKKEIYTPSELNAIPAAGSVIPVVSANQSELESEVDSLRREINRLRIKEVEMQQTQFGQGIND
ncbi:MAG: glycoside hydrolase family 2 TIM barrel-domain containing protein [Bacteroidales bacterium]